MQRNEREQGTVQPFSKIEEEKQGAEKQSQTSTRLKPKLNLKYKDENGSWVKAKILSRAGKVGGKHDGWFNVEISDGTRKAVKLSDVADIEVDEEQVLAVENFDQAYNAKLKELESWSVQKVYEEVEDQGQEYITLRWVVTPKVIEGKPSVKARLVAREFEEIQNFRTDSPTCSKERLRIALMIIAANEWSLNSLDVKTAFL